MCLVYVWSAGNRASTLSLFDNIIILKSVDGKAPAKSAHQMFSAGTCLEHRIAVIREEKRPTYLSSALL